MCGSSYYIFMKGGISVKRAAEFYRAHRKTVNMAAVVFAAGIIYYILIETTSFGIPCIFNKITGLACPGCGISRMIVSILHLDFIGAAQKNLALAVLLPIWLILFAVHIFFKPSWLQKNSKAEKIILFASITVLLIFGILRNLPGMEFLLP